MTSSPGEQMRVGPLSGDDLVDWYAVPPGGRDGGGWVRASLVTTLDGRATGTDGVSASLNAGSEGDHAVFTHLRRWADVVVVAAGTVRAEGYPPLEEAPMIVVSQREELPPSLAGADPSRVVLVSGHGRPVPAGPVLQEARRRGWTRVLVEGGPSLFGRWLQEGALDELCVTVRPVLAGGDGPTTVPRGLEVGAAGAPGLVGRPTHVLLWGGDVLLRVALRPGPGEH